MNKTKPPKDREFLGLVVSGNNVYWDIFFWATKEDGVPRGGYHDRGLFEMPAIFGWIDLPEVELSDEDCSSARRWSK